MELTDLNLLLKLLFSHLIVDFILQTNKIVRKKREGKYQYHIIHSHKPWLLILLQDYGIVGSSFLLFS